MEQKKTTKLQPRRKVNGLSNTSSDQENKDLPKKHGRHDQSMSGIPYVKHNFEQNDKDKEINVSYDKPVDRQTAETSENVRASITAMYGLNEGRIDQQGDAKSNASDEGEDAEVFEIVGSSSVTKPTSPSRLPVPLRSKIRPASVSLPITLDANYSSNEDLTKFMSPKLPRSGRHRIKKPEISLPKLWDFKRNSTESIHTIKEKSDGSPKSNSPKANNGKASLLPRPLASDQGKPSINTGNDCNSDLNTHDTSEECFESSNIFFTKGPNDLEDICGKLKSNFDNIEEPYMLENDGGLPLETSEFLRTTDSDQTDPHTATATAELRSAAIDLNSTAEAQTETFEVSSAPEPVERGTSKSNNNDTDPELHDTLSTSPLAEVKDIEEPHAPAGVLEYDTADENTSDISSIVYKANLTEDIQGTCMSDAIKKPAHELQDNDHESLPEDNANIREHLSLCSEVESVDTVNIKSLNVVTNAACENEHHERTYEEELEISLDSLEVIGKSTENVSGNASCVRVNDIEEDILHEIPLRSSDGDNEILEVLHSLVNNDVHVPKVKNNSDTADNQSTDKTREIYHTEISVLLDNDVSGSQMKDEVASEVNGSAIPKHAANESDKATKCDILLETTKSEVLKKENRYEMEECIALSATSEKEVHGLREVDKLLDKEVSEIIEKSSVKDEDTSSKRQQNDKVSKHEEHLDTETTETDIGCSENEKESSINILAQSDVILEETGKDSQIDNIVEDNIQFEQNSCETSLYENSKLVESETNQSVDSELSCDKTDLQISDKATADDAVDENQTTSVVRKYIPYVIPIGMGIVGAWIWLRHK